MTIRLAEPADAETLAEVHVTSWQAAYRGIFPDDFLDNLDRDRRSAFFRERIGAGTEVLVSESMGEVVGFCWVGHARDSPGWGEVVAIYVHPDHWGDGHGYRLLRRGEEDLTAAGHTMALLWVLADNHRGRRFYERQGWAESGTSKMEDIAGSLVTEIRYQRSLGGV